MNSLTHILNPDGSLSRKPAKEGKRKKKGKIVPAKGKTSWGRIYADGREVCDLKHVAGREEYFRRRLAMSVRQNEKCCFCGRRMGLFDISFEHENGRGAGKQDDRIEIDGKPYNKAAHGYCNLQAGSPKRSKRA